MTVHSAYRVSQRPNFLKTLIKFEPDACNAHFRAVMKDMQTTSKNFEGVQKINRDLGKLHCRSQTEKQNPNWLTDSDDSSPEPSVAHS